MPSHRSFNCYSKDFQSIIPKIFNSYTTKHFPRHAQLGQVSGRQQEAGLGQTGSAGGPFCVRSSEYVDDSCGHRPASAWQQERMFHGQLRSPGGWRGRRICEVCIGAGRNANLTAFFGDRVGIKASPGVSLAIPIILLQTQSPRIGPSQGQGL